MREYFIKSRASVAGPSGFLKAGRVYHLPDSPLLQRLIKSRLVEVIRIDGEEPKPVEPAPVKAEAPKPVEPAPVKAEAPKPVEPAPVKKEAAKPVVKEPSWSGATPKEKD